MENKNKLRKIIKLKSQNKYVVVKQTESSPNFNTEKQQKIISCTQELTNDIEQNVGTALYRASTHKASKLDKEDEQKIFSGCSARDRSSYAFPNQMPDNFDGMCKLNLKRITALMNEKKENITKTTTKHNFVIIKSNSIRPEFNDVIRPQAERKRHQTDSNNFTKQSQINFKIIQEIIRPPLCSMHSRAYINSAPQGSPRCFRPLKLDPRILQPFRSNLKFRERKAKTMFSETNKYYSHNYSTEPRRSSANSSKLLLSEIAGQTSFRVQSTRLFPLIMIKRSQTNCRSDPRRNPNNGGTVRLSSGAKLNFHSLRIFKKDNA